MDKKITTIMNVKELEIRVLKIGKEDYISFNLNLLMTYNKLGGNYV